MPTRVRSHAKINLGLYIGAPRADGFHSLVTVYQTLEMHDIVTVSARRAAATAINLTSNDERVPTDERNTAWKMVSLALEALEVRANVEIHIEKRLPVQGGLGAGSANAVAALVALEKELGIREQGSAIRDHDRDQGTGIRDQARRPGAPSFGPHLPEGWETTKPTPSGAPSFGPHLPEGWETTKPTPSGAPSIGRQLPDGWESTEPIRNWPAHRLDLAAQVGSDVPLFFVGGAVLGLDRGQEVYPMPDFEPVWCVVAIPALAVSTPQAFRDWDALCAEEGLTDESSASKLKRLSRAYASAFSGIPGTGETTAGSSGVFSTGEDLAGPHETSHGSGLVRTGILSWIENDFERVVFRQHPSLAEIKRTLAATDTPEAALHASLSGSGSALFGLYSTRGDAEAAKVRLAKQFPEHEPRSVLTRTLPRAEYWRGMLLE